MIKVKEGDDKFEVTLDVSQYRPEELKVTTLDNVLSIEGRHEAASGDAGAGTSSSSVRQFSRKWTLPPGTQNELVSSNLSSDGILMVTAPRNPALAGGEQQKSIK